MSPSMPSRVGQTLAICLLSLGIATAPIPTIAAEGDRLLAVLEFRSDSVDASMLSLLADSSRAGALSATLGKGITVMTRENMEFMLRSNGKDTCVAEGECDVDTARLIGANYIVTGAAARIGATYVVTLKLHSDQGALLATQQIRHEHPVELLSAVQETTYTMLRRAFDPEATTQSTLHVDDTVLASSKRMKELYDAERIAICTNPRQPKEFWFCDLSGVITENEFVRRYEGATGSAEISHANKRRNLAGTITLGAFTAATAGLAWWGFANLSRPCAPSDIDYDEVSSDCAVDEKTKNFGRSEAESGGRRAPYDADKTVANPYGIVAGVVGTISVLIVGGNLISALFSYDGDPEDHLLSEPEARRRAEQHNRALLERLNRSFSMSARSMPSRSAPPLVLEPYADGRTFGISGRF